MLAVPSQTSPSDIYPERLQLGYESAPLLTVLVLGPHEWLLVALQAACHGVRDCARRR